MKYNIFSASILLFVLQSASVFALDVKEYRGEADQYYSEHNFKKAHKMYLKLAKMGDHYSQGQVAVMYANGEGKGANLDEAYAWTVLAAEGGGEELSIRSDELLLQINDQAKAEKRAAKLQKKYGETALKEKARKREIRKLNHEMGGCTGSKLGCSGG